MLNRGSISYLNNMKVDSRLPAHSSYQGFVSRMSLQLALQRRGASYEVAIIKETPVWGATISLILIISACAPDSTSECIQIEFNCKQLPPGILERLIRCVDACHLSRLEIRGLFSVLPASWQPAVKPQPQSAPAEKRLAARPHRAPTASGLTL